MSTAKYTGSLGEPRVVEGPGLLDNDEEVRQWAAEQTRIDFEMLGQLLRHYQIAETEECWLRLCLALARDHVPGFRRKQKAGNKKKWGEAQRMLLVLDMERELPRQRNSIKKCAFVLAQRDPWRTFLAKSAPNGGGEERLRTEYFSAKKTDMAEIAREWLRLEEMASASGTEVDGSPPYSSGEAALDAHLQRIGKGL